MDISKLKEKIIIPERMQGTTAAKIVPVIMTTSKVGLGIKEDPIREVTQFWSLDGKLLCTADNYGVCNETIKIAEAGSEYITSLTKVLQQT